MKRMLVSGVGAMVLASSALANTDNPTELHISKTDGSMESGWIVSNPSGVSDYFNVRYDFAAATVVSGASISVGDFGATSSFPVVGYYSSNLGLDPSGATPDLALPLVTAASPPVLGGGLFDFCHVPMSPTSIPAGSAHLVLQFLPGDPGLLGIGADTDLGGLGGDETPGVRNPADSTSFSSDGYATAGVPFTAGDAGLNAVLDSCDYVTNNGATLRILVDCADLTGDYTLATTAAGEDFGFSVAAPSIAGFTTFALFFVSNNGVLLSSFGFPRALTDAGDSCIAYSRVCANWPFGVGGLTINFRAAVGTAGVVGSVSLTNEVTVHALPDPPNAFAAIDDGTYETSWSAQAVSGPSDYFSNALQSPNPGGIAVSSLELAVSDFGTTFTAFPSAGNAPPNTVLDPTGVTPDLGNPYVSQPFPFPALTFVTTSGQLVSQAVTTFTPSGDVLPFVQFPSGDASLLSIGADTDSAISGLSAWSLDGYSTAGNVFGAGNWGIRVQ